MERKKTFIVIAAYNEEGPIGSVVRRCKKKGYPNVVVVDDGSKDDTMIVAQQAGAIALQHSINLGKGGAMKTGAEYAISHGAKAIIFLDADGQHNPEELGRFQRRLDEGYEIVFGVRKQPRKMPFIRRFGKFVMSHVVKTLYGLRVRDVLCGYRAMTAEAYKKVRWQSRNYTVETEIVARTGNQHLRYTTIGIETIYHDKYKGMTLFDGIRIIWTLFWWRLNG